MHVHWPTLHLQVRHSTPEVHVLSGKQNSMPCWFPASLDTHTRPAHQYRQPSTLSLTMPYLGLGWSQRTPGHYHRSSWDPNSWWWLQGSVPLHLNKITWCPVTWHYLPPDSRSNNSRAARLLGINNTGLSLIILVSTTIVLIYSLLISWAVKEGVFYIRPVLQ